MIKIRIFAVVLLALGLAVNALCQDCAPGSLTASSTPSWLPSGGGQVTLQATMAPVAGNAFRFDGVDDYLTATASGVPVTNSFTMEGWAKPEVTHQIDGQSATGTGGTSGQRYLLFPEQGDLVWGSGHAGTGISVGTNGVSVYEHASEYMPAVLAWSGTLSGWTHIAVVYENRVPKLYINGNLVKTGQAGSKSYLHAPVRVGGVQYGFFKGEADEFRVWSGVRTQVQIQAGMNRSLSGTTAGLWGSWHLDETGSTAYNSSSTSAPTLTATGGAMRVASTAPLSPGQFTWSGPGLFSTSGPNVTASLTQTGSFTVTADGANGCTATATVSVKTDYNFVKMRVPQVRIQDEVALIQQAGDKDKVQTTAQYIDGLGRPLQTVQRQASAAGRDIVQPFAYDLFGREAKKYLPYAAPQPSGDGSYRPDAIKTPAAYTSSEQYAFYQASGDKIANDAAPYAESIFEASPLNKVVKQGAAGQAWQPDAVAAESSTDKTVKLTQKTNTLEEVRLWQLVNGAWSAPGFYGVNELLVTQTRDEHQALALDYKDKEGRVVLKKVQESDQAPTSDAGFLLTYYVYDDLGNLRLVIPPQAVRQMPANWAPDQSFISSWCFSYEYDGRNRIVEKQVPGAGKVSMVYDNLDRLVLSQDANQKQRLEWVYTKYDVLSRPVETGIYKPGADSSRLSLQANLDKWLTTHQNHTTASSTLPSSRREGETIISSQYDGYTEYVASNSITLLPGFEMRAEGSKTFTASIGAITPTTNSAYPVAAHLTEPLTFTYYDDYSHAALQPARYAFVAQGLRPERETTFFTRVKGQVTGQRVKTLVSNEWLTTVNYYDDNYRLIESISDNHLGVMDHVSTTYDFTGKVLETMLTHTKPSQETRVVQTEHDYDHGGRLLQSIQRVGNPVNIGNATPVIIASNRYNELGQLVDKGLHSTNAKTTPIEDRSFLQSVDYRYSIRGWMTHLNNRNLSVDAETNDDNNDVFGLELKYERDQQLGALSAGRQQFNGNISEALWRSSSDNVLRGYSYAYDKASRLKVADYRADEGNNWASEPMERYSVSNINYDGNGNILSMKRRGLVDQANGLKTYGLLDNLKYYYGTIDGNGNAVAVGNRLLAVDDRDEYGALITTATDHDFEDKNGRVYNGNPINAEYGYDENGNMIRDDNKGISQISYNHLNLPVKISFDGGNWLEYIYTAAGAKLQKRVYTNGVQTGTTDYAGSLVYENNSLQFVHMPEGRIVYQPSVTGKTWKYEYMIKDHLGNTRVAIGEPEEEKFVATAESENSYERGEFLMLDETRAVVPSAFDFTKLATGSPEVMRLNLKRLGDITPGKQLHVMPGDVVKATVRVKYLDLRRNGTSEPDVSLMMNALTGQAGYSIVPDATGSAVYSPGGILLGFLMSGSGSSGSPPLAYLKYYLMDNNKQRIANSGGMVQVTEAAAVYDATSMINPHELLTLQIPEITQAGYVVIQLSHELNNGVAEDVDIYFDDLTVTHEHLTVQENHYDPWGQNLVGIEKQGIPNFKYQYNGKEKQSEFGLNWNDHGWRFYDPQIGRWHVIDPDAEENQEGWSPYHFVLGNPIIHNDPDGRIPVLGTALMGAVIGGGMELGGQLLAGKPLSQVDWVDVGVETLKGGLIGSGVGAGAGGLIEVGAVITKASLDFSMDDGVKNVFNGTKSKTEAAFDGAMDVVGGKVGGSIGKRVSAAAEGSVKNSLKAEARTTKSLVKANNSFNKVTDGGKNMYGSKAMVSSAKLSSAKSAAKAASARTSRAKVVSSVVKGPLGETVNKGVQNTMADQLKSSFGIK